MVKTAKQAPSKIVEVKITKIDEGREGMSRYAEDHDAKTCPHCIAGQNGNNTRCKDCEKFVLPDGKIGRPWGAGNCEKMTVFTGTVISFATEDGQIGQVVHEGSKYDEKKVNKLIAKWQGDVKKMLSMKHPAEGKTITVKV